MSHVDERLREVFEQTEDSGEVYTESLDSINYFKLRSKAAANDGLYKLMGNDLCMFRCDYKDKDAIMIIFSIPINSDEDTTGAKNVAERVMEVIEATERYFVTIDNLRSEEVKEDKFVYVTMIKILNGSE